MTAGSVVEATNPLKKGREGAKGKDPSRTSLSLDAIGLEAEFAVLRNGIQVRPEDLFGSPRRFIRTPMMHRTGRSFHLPTGGAIYFDTGVIEVATPVIEIDRGCGARAGRSLWESILFVRRELDAWERKREEQVRLAGFSTHYNISFDPPARQRTNGRSVESLALLLTHILPVPVMMLAANKRSTGIGVRPRGNRIEVTADFTPSAPLMVATATLVVGIVREVMRWGSFDLSELDGHDLPVVSGFTPLPHSSRRGWVAKAKSFSHDPFGADVNAKEWKLTTGEMISLREMAGRIARKFWPAMKCVADPFSLRLIGSVMRGRAPSLLELPDRPTCYEDVGRACTWDNLFPERILPRSQYERVLIRAISGDKLCMGGHWYTPVGMQGWATVVFRREDGARRHFTLDFLLDHLDDWERARSHRPRTRTHKQSQRHGSTSGESRSRPIAHERQTGAANGKNQ
jgi:hypothetical protein